MSDPIVVTLTFREAVEDYRIGDTLTGEAALEFIKRGVDPMFYFVTHTPADSADKE